MRERRLEGFTLVELMVVVIIIGVLAAIIVPNLMHAAERAKIAATKDQIKQIETAIGMFKLETGTYPTSLEELVHRPGNFTGIWPREGFMKDVPKDGWGRDFKYVMPGPGEKSYEIKSLGAEGQEGGTDENADITN